MLVRHSLIYVVSKLIPGLLGLATAAILTRLLDPEHYGLYGLALVVMSFGATMGFEWLNISFLRFYQARREDNRVIGTVVYLFAMMVALSALAFGIIWWSGLIPVSEQPIYEVGLVLMWAYAWFELASKFEIADFRPVTYFAMNLQRSVCMLAGAVGGAWLTHDPVWTAAGTALGILAGSLPVRTQGLRLGRDAFDTVLAREIIGFGIPLAASMVMSSILINGTRAMVEWLGSPEALGYYTAAFVLVQNTLVVLASGIAAAGYSLAVRAVESGDPVAARRQLLDNGTLLLLVMAPASLGMALTAHGLAVTLVGPRYVASVSMLTPWLAIGTFFGTIRAHFLDHAFQLGRKPHLQIRVIGVAAIIAISLSFWLIPRIGSEGAAIAVAIAMAISCVHARIEGASAYPMPLPVSGAVKIAVSCFVMALSVHALAGDTVMEFILQVAVGGFVYATSIMALNVLGVRDNAMRIIRSKKTRR